jgi:hypothetical protein
VSQVLVWLNPTAIGKQRTVIIIIWSDFMQLPPYHFIIDSPDSGDGFVCSPLLFVGALQPHFLLQ